MALLRIQLLGAARVFHADHTYDARLTHTLQPCKTLVDKAISAGCKGVEALLDRLGATITDAQKEEIQRRCSAAADKSM